MASILRVQKWRKVQFCRDFMIRHKLAFSQIDLKSLQVQAAGGGISNLSLIWSCKTIAGQPVKYFAKIFLPIGTFWANASPLVSPAPQIYGSRSRHRFEVDIISRAQLAELHVAVPRLILFDPIEKVMVTEYLDGVMLSDILKQMANQKIASEEQLEILNLCGSSVGKAHAAGFSLIDIQPSNCLWVASRKQIYFIDLEFCSRQDRRTWDVGYFFAFLTVLLPQTELARKAKEAFWKGYQSHYQPNWPDLEKTNALLLEYLPIFQTIMDIRDYTPDELFNEIFSFSVNQEVSNKNESA